MADLQLLMKITVAGIVLISVAPSTALWLTENLALKGMAHQSVDVSKTFTAHYAIDGNRAANFSENSCTYITSNRNSWWRLTLQRPYNIAMVSITNRGDCCANQINGAEIRVGNSLVNDGNSNKLVNKINSIRPGVTRNFRFLPVNGKYVNVLLPGQKRILTLCEVEVYAISEDMQVMVKLNRINVAPNGRATQSSVNQDSLCLGVAQNAIDGNRHSDLFRGSCSQTNTENDPWWRLDLTKSYKIESVALTNRGDCCSEELNGAVIHIGDSLESEGWKNPVCSKVSFIPAGGTETLRCFNVLQGRYVTVALPGENRTLSLCEVEVFGVPTEQTEP